MNSFIQSFKDKVESESLLDSPNLEEHVIYIGLNYLFYKVRMQWLDGHGNSRMYKNHLQEDPNNYGARVEGIIGINGIISVESYSERKDRKQCLQDLLIGKKPNMDDDWIQTMDVSSAFKDGKQHSITIKII